MPRLQRLGDFADQIEQVRSYLSTRLDELAVASKSLRDELHALVTRRASDMPHVVRDDSGRIPIEVLP